GGGGSEHDAGFGGKPALHDDVEAIDVVLRNPVIGELGHFVSEGLRRAVPVAELYPAAHDVVIGQGVAAVLAAANFDRHFAGDRAEPDLTATRVLGGRHGDRHGAVVDRHGDRQRQRLAALPALRD